jgi:uracil-DNA glycosylase
LPALMQEVHAFTRFLFAPGWLTECTTWMFGSQRRLVRRWECDTDLPKPGPFPQISHTAAMRHTLFLKSQSVLGANDRYG